MHYKLNPILNTMIVFAAALLLVSACEQTPTQEETPLRSVRTVQVNPTANGNNRVFLGISQSEQVTQLSFRISGTVSELPIKIGDRLKKGSLVAKLDAATYELQAEQARANLAQATASERNATSTYQRVKGLYENNNAAKTDLDSARAAAESAQAQVKAAEKALQLARLNVQYTRLIANGDCAVAQTNVEVNENVNSGTPIATVDCGNQIKVNIAVPEGIIAAVRNGQAATVSFDAIPNRVFNGTVEEVGVSATGAGSTFPVAVSINDHDSRLRSGLAAEVTMQFSDNTGKSNIYLPVSAVNKNNSGEFVFIAVPIDKDTAKVELRQVTIGELTDQGVAILSGLSAGERVISAGTKVIRPDMTVLIE